MREKIELVASSAYSAGLSLNTLQARRIEAQQLASHVREVASYAREVVERGAYCEEGYMPPSDTEGLRPHTYRGTDFVPLNDVDSVALREESPDEKSLVLLVRHEVVGVRRQTEKVAIIKPGSIEVVEVGPAQSHELQGVWGLLEYIDAYQQSEQAQAS